MSEWKTVSLGEVAEFIRGITFKPADVIPVGEPGSVACMRTKNIQAELDCSDVWGVNERLVARSSQFLKTGDILVSSANSWNLVGKSCWIPNLPWRATFGGFVSVLRARSSAVDSRFLFYWFSSRQVQVTVRSFGQQTTNISNLNIDRCLRLPLHLPPLAEQRRIVEVLDRTEGVRIKRRVSIRKVSTLAQVVFDDMFGDPAKNSKNWPRKLIRDLASKMSDGPFGSNLKSSDYKDSGIRVVRLQNIGVGEFLDNDKAYISEEHFAGLKKHECKPGDVIVGTLGDPNLRACILPSWLHIALNKADCVQLRPDARVATSSYICGLLNHPATEKMAHSLIVGQTRLRISMGRLSNLVVPVPPISLQKEFDERIEILKKMKAKHYASLAEMDALFASLQHRAFRGEL